MTDDGISQQNRINNIAVIYCESSAYNGAREIERLADEEIIEVATAVKSGLDRYGYRVDLVALEPSEIGGLSRYDHVFNLVETIFGYPLTEYEVAQELERLRIPFTGSQAATLKTCLNKAATKAILVANNITTPDFELIEPGEKIAMTLPYPVIVKPVHEDGCVGISVDSRINNLEQLICQVNKIHTVYQQAALIESFIEGRDITAAVLGNGSDARLLPLSEIVYADKDGPGHLTFDANWVAGSSEYQDSRSSIVGKLDANLQEQIEYLALSAVRVMGCRDYARVDFRIRDDKPYVLEVNPNPCINPDGAGFVKSAKAAGYSYPELVKTILEMSILNYPITTSKKNEKVYAL